ncbi:LexA family protein [Methylotenera versatilis]|uniref:Peptidase S24/S26A/S26B, conserved region n=1 Tax=Methylotenera versatilis (strain 301) TaxID=666681 RepID=D7DL92_METV0|nr:translesion error-prone DNA polymerase V autoproteolytic subunit [Methylotenera versatilis]ADI30563.1 Peptidase S24/S26A/S26B, conserved region [Methylotenera versatilis 301]
MAQGGKRPNSGPNRSMSPYGEKTSVIRVPASIKSDVLVYLDAFKKKAASAHDITLGIPQALPNPPALARPIYSGNVSAGQSRFPSPAQDYEQKFLDLNDRYITNPPATFFFQVKGDSMIGAGIYDGSTVIVDRAVKPKSSSIIIADVDGEWMVKRLYKRGNVVKLLSENPEHAPIVLAEGQELVIFGVVMYVIHQPK